MYHYQILQGVNTKLMSQLNEKTFELEIMSAENCILQEQLQTKAVEIEKMKQEKVQKGGLEMQCQKLTEEASYAKELASADIVELKSLIEDFT